MGDCIRLYSWMDGEEMAAFSERFSFPTVALVVRTFLKAGIGRTNPGNPMTRRLSDSRDESACPGKAQQLLPQ